MRIFSGYQLTLDARKRITGGDAHEVLNTIRAYEFWVEAYEAVQHLQPRSLAAKALEMYTERIETVLYAYAYRHIDILAAWEAAGQNPHLSKSVYKAVLLAKKRLKQQSCCS